MIGYISNHRTFTTQFYNFKLDSISCGIATEYPILYIVVIVVIVFKYYRVSVHTLKQFQCFLCTISIYILRKNLNARDELFNVVSHYSISKVSFSSMIPSERAV